MKYWVGSILILFCFACQEPKTEEIQAWPQEKFVEVLTEVQVAEALIRLGYHRNINDSILITDSIYQRIFDELGVEQSEFEANFDYYSKRPEEMEEIYNAVIDRLSTREAEQQGKMTNTQAPS